MTSQSSFFGQCQSSILPQSSGSSITASDFEVSFIVPVLLVYLELGSSAEAKPLLNT